MTRVYVLGGLTLVLILAALAAGFGLSTGWAVKALQDEAQTRLGRTLAVKEGVSLHFSPRLTLHFSGVELGNVDGIEGSFISAAELRVPVSLSDIVRRRLGGRFELGSPQISLEVDAKGQVSWTGPAKGPPLPETEQFLIRNGTIRYFDQRNQQSLVVPQVNAAGSLSPEGTLTLEGNATLGGRLSGFTAELKDVGRTTALGSPFNFSLDSPLLAASFEGRLSVRPTLNLAGPLSLSGKSLRNLGWWVGVPIGGNRGFGAFVASGTLDSAGIGFTLRDANVTIDGVQAKGDIGMTMDRLVPVALAKLEVPEFDLGQYIAAADPHRESWSEAPLSYDALRGLNARLTLRAGKASLGAIVLNDASIEASLAGGKLAAIISTDGLAGGRGRIDLELDGTSEAPLFSARLMANGAQAQDLLRAFTGQGWIRGIANADVSVSGFGNSVAEIVSTLKGAATFAVKDGALQGIDGQKVLSAVSQKIVDGWSGGTTPFASLAGSFIIADGIGQSTDLLIESEGLSIPASGQVDLLRRALDFSATPRLSSAGGAVGLPVAVIVKGPWGSPRIYPDVADILLKPEEAFAKLKAMGLPEQAPANN